MADDRPEEGLQEKLREKLEERLEDRPDDAVPPESGRAKRAPPTIDLDASEVSGETRSSAGSVPPVSPPREPESPEAAESEDESDAAKPAAPAARPVSAPISPWVIAPLSGAVAAALVIGVGWMLGWPEVQQATPAAPQVSAAAADDLAARVAGLSSKVDSVVSRPVAPASDPAAAARLAALESSLAALRDDIAAVRTQSDQLAEKLAAAPDADGVKSAPVEAAPPVDLSGITGRLDQVERASRAQGNAIAQQSAKLADDLPLRRVVVASLLDIAVRQGDPYAAPLAAAKALAADPDALKPLEDFAATGVPTAATLSRELLTLVPKLSPPAVQPADSASADLVDRLKVGASRLVRIERTDAVGNDRGAVVARVTAAALRNESNEARRELKTLSPDDRAAAQAWIDKTEARDAALAAARQFAADAMTALANPAQ